MAGRTDSAARFVAAPPERIYAALVDPEALAAWLPPAGMTGRFERFDARPGGTYRMVLTYDDASGAPGKSSADADVIEGSFVELVPGELVVQSGVFDSDDPAFAEPMTTTWRLSAVAGGTHVEICAENVPDAISAEDHQAGFASSLENLERFVRS